MDIDAQIQKANIDAAAKVEVARIGAAQSDGQAQLAAEDKKFGKDKSTAEMEMQDKQHKANTAMEMYKHHTQPPKGGNTE